MDGADYVELDDGAPVDAFVPEGGGGVEALEFWEGGRGLVWVFFWGGKCGDGWRDGEMNRKRKDNGIWMHLRLRASSRPDRVIIADMTWHARLGK